MVWKNPKLWGLIITVVLALVGAFTGMDIKKSICGDEPSVMEVPAPAAAVPAVVVPGSLPIDKL
jgi:hypothetical protein